MSKRVVVTGAGGISALGNNWTDVKASLLAQENRVRYMHEWDRYKDLNTRLAAPVELPPLPSHYTRKRTRTMGRVALFGVRATELALESAGLLGDPILKSGEVGVAYGSATGSTVASLELSHLLEENSMARVTGTSYLRLMSHTAAVNISVFFGTTGRMYTTTSACTAGSQGIGYAYEAIRNGQQLIMLAGGAEELCVSQAAVFDVVGGASLRNNHPELSPAPFSEYRDGIVLGEGGATLILEELEHAKARGAHILAEVVGYATNTDGQHIVRQNQATMARVMTMALQDASLDSSAIGYISAHGTATDVGDIAESMATQTIMGSYIPISSLKSYVGHSLGASGALEAWWTILMMNEGWFAPTLNLDVIDSRCGALDYIYGNIREIQTEYVMSNNFAFGGINTSLIFRRYPA